MAKDKNQGGDQPAQAKKAKAPKGGGAQQKKKKKGGDAPPPVYKRDKPPRLRTVYETEVREKLQKEFGYTNVMQIPRIVKVSVNMGLGRAVQTPKILESAVEELRMITGQGPVVTTAKMDIANFKLRVGHKIGAMVTLRSHRMWEFLDRLISIALPRVRDFKGVSDKAFDGRGNYSLGIKEQIIFPEIDYDNIDSVNGFNITIVTTANTDDEARALLRALGMPFRKSGAAAQAA